MWLTLFYSRVLGAMSHSDIYSLTRQKPLDLVPGGHRSSTVLLLHSSSSGSLHRLLSQTGFELYTWKNHRLHVFAV